MLDPDISTSDALALLSTPVDGDAPGPAGWSRRRFLSVLGGVAAGSTLAAVFDAIPSSVREAFAGPPIAATDRLLVVVTLFGGNDGLNTVVPYTDSTYLARRGSLVLNPGQVLPLTATKGLHANLPTIKSLFDAGQVAIVEGVGYPNPDLSHFTSMGIWMAARVGAGSGTGWVGRWHDTVPLDRAQLASVTLNRSVPLHLVGARSRAVAVATSGAGFGTNRAVHDLRVYEALRSIGASAGSSGRGPLYQAYAQGLVDQLDVVDATRSVYQTAAAAGTLAGPMSIAARLFNADVGVRVVDCPLDGFDTHANQRTAHANLLAALDAGVKVFFEQLSPSLRARAIVLIQSEFGRTVGVNGSAGTDHGTAAPTFVIGSPVRGGWYGQPPSLTSLDRYGRPSFTVDFRSVLATVIEHGLNVPASDVLGGNVEMLGFLTPLAAPPAPAPAPAPAPVSVEGVRFVPLVPQRIIDTRDGTGGRSGELGAGEEWPCRVAGVGGVPIDAAAVAVNMTAVDATASSFITVWPSGEGRPLASNINPRPGAATPNMVVVRPGVDGMVRVFNASGTVQVVADVVGYFTGAGGSGFVPLDPARLCDTRDAGGPVGAGRQLDVVVSGRGGVPADCDAVLVNVTVTNASTASYLTVWPTGTERPLASSLNMGAGDTVANMVAARVGENGSISIFNASGSTDVIVDVLGAFRPAASSTFVPLSPNRVLDSRIGLGTATGKLGRGSTRLTVNGRGGVPVSGVSAVLLNVTAVGATGATYLSLYPAGAQRPNASNVNVTHPSAVPNTAVVRLGVDGSIDVWNNSGSVDVIADVLGYFTS